MMDKSAKIVVIFLLALGLAACQDVPDDFCQNYDPDTVVHLPYPYAGHCNLYVECYAFLPRILECEDGHWWNTQADSCQEPGPYCSGWQNYLCANENPNIRVLKPYPGDCTRYVECFGNNVYYHQCSGGLWWNPNRNLCDYPGNYCGSNDPSPTVLPIWCWYADPTNIVYYPYPYNCSFYIECFDYVGYLYQCEEGLWWHEQIHVCDYPGAYCSNSAPNQICRGVEHDYFPDIWSCSRYIQCDEGDSIEMICPEGLYFDSQTKECREPLNSDCCRQSPPNRCA